MVQADQAAFQMPLGKWTSPHLQEVQSTWHGLYDWSCRFFHDSYEQELADLKEGHCPAEGKLSSERGAAALDPLSESGTLQLYFTERNRQVLSEAEKLATSNPWLDSSTSSSGGYAGTLSELQVEPDGMPTSETKTQRLTQTSILDGNRATSNLKVGGKNITMSIFYYYYYLSIISIHSLKSSFHPSINSFSLMSLSVSSI